MVNLLIRFVNLSLVISRGLQQGLLRSSGGIPTPVWSSMITPDPPSTRNLRATHPSGQLQRAIFVRLNEAFFARRKVSTSIACSEGAKNGSGTELHRNLAVLPWQMIVT